MTYYARSENAKGEKETVTHHLGRASELCTQFLSEIGYEDWGYILGASHDFGKLSFTFQQVLERKKKHVNHALPGATLLFSLYKKSSLGNARLMATVIASHHCGLKNFYDYESEINQSYIGTGENLDRENREYSLFGKEEYQLALKEWKKDFVPKKKLTCAPSFEKDEDELLSKMLFERFLFSSLVDADWSSSAEHFDADYLMKHTGPKLNPQKVMGELLLVQQTKRRNSTAAFSLNVLRDQLFDACVNVGVQEPGLFTLTAPTGLGKTLSLFAFAVQHCLHHHKRRIILVLPYLSIIEQNCKDYREIVPELIELHSNVHWTDETRMLAERWDAPCIVTTNVSFFEPLFSAQPGECRHLHQLANSVIVLDEAQSLPAHLLDATLRTVKLLCDNYGCTVVFSTATQPSFQHRPGLHWNPREIAPDSQMLFSITRRVKWNWKVDEPISFSKLAEEVSVHSQCCIIVNLKRHARNLLNQLKTFGRECDLFYLSTDLCSAHRSDMLDEVKKRLKSGMSCCLVATQCIEAGVDLDFPVVYRALAPLDSLIQAAGRCNRNGDSPDGQMTVILPFDENGKLYPSAEYERAALCVSTLLSRHEIDCNNLSHIDEYYQLLYGNNTGDKIALRDAIQREDYVETERQYSIIEQEGVQVIVPYTGKIELYNMIRERVDKEGLTNEIIKQAKELTVSSFDKENVDKYCNLLYHYSWESKQMIPTKYYLLGIPQYYDDKQGLNFEEMFNGIFDGF